MFHKNNGVSSSQIETHSTLGKFGITQLMCNLFSVRFICMYCKGPSINDDTHYRGEGGCPKRDVVREVAWI